MLHKDYVGTTFYAYNYRSDKGYKLICDIFEKVDKILMSDKSKLVELYKFKYSNPSEQEILKYEMSLGMGVYCSGLFTYYLDKI